MKKYSFIVTKQNKLLKFLEDNLPQYKYSQFNKALREKDIKIDGVRAKENVLLCVGNSVEIFLDDKTIEKKYEVFYEDDNIVVFNKQKGIEVCDGEFNIQQDYEKEHQKIYPVHRLDRNTTGLVVFAKSENICNSLIEIFKNHCVKKYYYAVVKKSKNKEDVLKSYLLKDKSLSTVKIFDECIKNSVYIETQYSVIKSKNDIDLLNVCIIAGKTHQIRAHLAHYGMPILGDEKYGDKNLNKMHKQKTQLLQAYKIQFFIKDDNKLKYLNDVKLELGCAFLNFF